MGVLEHLFKPSTLISAVILVIFIILAIVASTNPNANTSFFQISQDAIKILVGALAGAVAGERYVQKGDKQ
ncbi:hypothetical protein HYU14_07690 [Candidatus Woesearchaeota archaeon]|nr:hypothetical protein [Candidatus Woesearchaeota archaeon]